MAEPMITYVSGILHHVVNVLLLCWRRVLRIGAIAGGVGILLVEITAAVLTHRFPDGPAQVVALVFGAALAYAAAITVIADEVLVGMIDIVRLMRGEAEAGARVAASATEREAGAMGAGLARLFGITGAATMLGRVGTGALRRTAPPRASQLDARAAAEPVVDEGATDETLADLAPPSNQSTVPPPVVGPPVRADRLPRIAWTDEHEAVRLDRGPRSRPTAPADRGATPAVNDAAPAGHDEPPIAPVHLPGLAEPATWHPEDAPLPAPGTWHDPVLSVEDDEDAGGIQPTDTFGGPPPSAITRPLPLITRPLERSGPPSAPRSSVWDHISQVLAGRPVDPLPDEEEDAGTPGEIP